jgi:hypothetical protein
MKLRKNGENGENLDEEKGRLKVLAASLAVRCFNDLGKDAGSGGSDGGGEILEGEFVEFV